MQGGEISWHMYDQFPSAVRAAYLNLFPFLPPTPEQIAADNQTLNPFEQFVVERTANWTATGMAFFDEQTTKVDSIYCLMEELLLT